MTDEAYNSLVQMIYESLIGRPDMGMGEMGECHDEAIRVVDEWMAKNNIKLH